MTANQVAAMLGVSRSWVYRNAAPHGMLPCYRMGDVVRFDRDQVEAFKRRCQCTGTLGVSVGVTSSRRPSAAGFTADLSYFRQAAQKLKQSGSTARKPRVHLR